MVPDRNFYVLLRQVIGLASNGSLYRILTIEIIFLMVQLVHVKNDLRFHDE